MSGEMAPNRAAVVNHNVWVNYRVRADGDVFSDNGIGADGASGPSMLKQQ